jgi:hypothetical protein
MRRIKEKENSAIKGRIRIITTDAKTGRILRRTRWMRNLIMLGNDTGKDLILDRLAGTNTYSLNITHADIGTGTNPPAASDTQLQNPTVRAVKTSASVSGNTLTLQFFFSDALLPNGTYREFGTFVDGSGTISTGRIFNRALFGLPYTKASGEDTTIEVQITIN